MAMDRTPKKQKNMGDTDFQCSMLKGGHGKMAAEKQALSMIRVEEAKSKDVDITTKQWMQYHNAVSLVELTVT